MKVSVLYNITNLKIIENLIKKGWLVLTEKALLDLNEFCEYMGIGKTKARELLKAPKNTYVVRIGNRLYVNKRLLDRWLDAISGN